MSQGDEIFAIELKDGVCIVAPSRAVDSLEWQRVDVAADSMLRATLGQTPPRMLFDLSDVDYFGSIFISLMLRCAKYVKEHQGGFGVCGLTPNTKRLIETAKLHTTWQIFPNRVTALAELNRT